MHAQRKAHNRDRDHSFLKYSICSALSRAKSTFLRSFTLPPPSLVAQLLCFPPLPTLQFSSGCLLRNFLSHLPSP